MYTKKLSVLIICFFTAISFLHAQVPARRLDTTMKVGKTGYRVNCTNKSPERNIVMISPLGFEKDAREISFEVKGRISKAEVDDINRDGFPDLVMYVFTNDSIPKGSVIGISSEKNESMGAIILPDIYDDPKIRTGYKGNDVFFLLEGYLIRRFPVYQAESAPAPAGSGTLMRQVTYQVVPGERGGLQFKPMRSNDFTKP